MPENRALFSFIGSLFALLLFVVGYSAILTPAQTLAYSSPSSFDLASVCDWSMLPGLNSEQYNTFEDVAAIAPNDVWAVGSQGPSATGELTIIEHWNGSAWSFVPSPDPGSRSNALLGVAAIAADDIWAVGYKNGNVGGSSLSLTMHWNGTAWTEVAAPSPASFENFLTDVVAFAADDVWAVGNTWSAGPRRRTFALHWNGNEWQQVATPSLGDFDNYLTALHASGPDDIWAVGHYENGTGVQSTLTLHWDGMAWAVVLSPNVPDVNNYLLGVSVLPSGEAWAVGYTCVGNCFGSNVWQLLTMRLDGLTWTIVPGPTFSSVTNWANDVIALAPNDVWAVGTYSTDTEGRTLTMHWDGTAWALHPSPNPNSCCPELQGLSALPSGEMWAVGDFHFVGNPVIRTLAERYPASCGSQTPTPPVTPSTATSTPVPPSSTSTSTMIPPSTTATSSVVPSTSTPTSISTSTSTSLPTETVVPPTNTPPVSPTVPPTSTATVTVQPSTPSVTATVCVIEFSDVLPGSTFYAYVQCLACQGIINGYSDGTFRPWENVTRGQLSKIVSNAAGFSETPAEQTFEDVLPGSTFYLYIERMAMHEVLGGYPCGGSGEPCGSGGRPYFRPGTNASRGQIAKIVSNAAGFSDIQLLQMFEDVPEVSTFYTWVYRLASRSIMQGYPCGGPGEPCGASQLPYFRPAYAATRGQVSKVVSTTFYPDCGE